MNKGYLVGGLAIVGAIALFAYLRPKPRRNSEGFFGASGMSRGMGSGSSLRAVAPCVRKNADGSTTTYNQFGGSRPCPYGGTVNA
jgi:hypothetical protein